jgi:hypothetical protein
LTPAWKLWLVSSVTCTCAASAACWWAVHVATLQWVQFTRSPCCAWPECVDRLPFVSCLHAWHALVHLLYVHRIQQHIDGAASSIWYIQRSAPLCHRSRLCAVNRAGGFKQLACLLQCMPHCGIAGCAAATGVPLFMFRLRSRCNSHVYMYPTRKTSFTCAWWIL